MSTNHSDLAEAPVSWRTRADAIRFKTDCYIDAQYQRSTSSQNFFDTVHPATGSVLARFPAGTGDDVDKAVRAARAAYQTTWAAVAPEFRKAALLRWADLLEARAEDLALRDCLEMGKPIQFALADVAAGVRFIRFYAETADKLYGDIAPTDPGKGMVVTLPEPWGVIGAIVPWNFPFLTACMAVAPTMSAGNTVVLKPSEQSPSSALLMAELSSEAGLPRGVINVVVGLGSTVGAALASHHDVDKLHFTGSTATGRKMLEYSAASNGKGVMLEVGGKNPQIVLADAAHIEGLGEALASAAFFNTGQVCVARSRLIVHEEVVDEVLEKINLAASKLVAGDPLATSTTYGPVSSKALLAKIDRYVETAVHAGAEAMPGATRSGSRGYWFPPTVLTHVSEDMPVAREEVFGPVISVHVVDSEEQAIQLANATRYGLAATAWTTDLKSAMRLARRLRAGRVEVRAGTAASSSLELFSAEPFGESGYGVLGGVRGIEPYIRWKGVEFIVA